MGSRGEEADAEGSTVSASSLPPAGQSSVRTTGYWDFDPDATVVCPCGWSGRAGDQVEHHVASMLLDVRCGACDRMLMVALYPTLEETRVAAAAGNPRAQAGLADIEAQAAERAAKAAQPHLSTPDQLPDLPGDVIIIDWALGGAGQALLHDGVQIWTEPSYYESYERFGQVFEILRQKYGERFAGLVPELDAEYSLYGDRLGSVRIVEDWNRSVRKPDEVLIAALGADRAAPYLVEQPRRRDETADASARTGPPSTEVPDGEADSDEREPDATPAPVDGGHGSDARHDPGYDIAGPGCETCRSGPPGVGEREWRSVDRASSFRPKFSYFYAKLLNCPDCSTTWLSGYYEDDSEDPLAEWGVRHFIYNRMTPRQLDVISAAAGSQRLDIDDFAHRGSDGP